MKRVFIIVLATVVFFAVLFLITQNLTSNSEKNTEIFRVNYMELNNIVNLKKSVILIIGGRGCCNCRMAEGAIKKSFKDDKFALFKKIEYKDLQNNQLINKKDLKGGIPLTLIIKNGVIVERILGFNEEIYIPKLDSTITENFE